MAIENNELESLAKEVCAKIDAEILALSSYFSEKGLGGFELDLLLCKFAITACEQNQCGLDRAYESAVNTGDACSDIESFVVEMAGMNKETTNVLKRRVDLLVAATLRIRAAAIASDPVVETIPNLER